MAFTARFHLLVLVTLLHFVYSRAQHSGSPPSRTGMEGFKPCEEADRIIELGKRITKDNKDEIFKDSKKVLRVGEGETPFERYNRAAFFYLCAKLLPGTTGPSLSLLRNEFYLSLKTARPIMPYVQRLISELNGYPLKKCAPKAIEEPVKSCAGQGELKHGSIQCTKNWNIQSECTFTCEGAGYALHPPRRSTNVCGPNQLWSLPKPCCSRPCPPNALMDLVLVLDSSSSVGAKNWVLLTAFVESVITSFNIAPDSTNVAFFRYNRDVDNTTEVFLNSYPTNVEALVRALHAIPYDGSGTFTGKALNHALTSSLLKENGNRPDVKTVVLVITDGKAADDVKTPAEAIRDTGAEILVVGIIPPRGRLDMEQLEDIAGSKENLVIANGGFGRLGKRFITKLASSICGDPCSR